MRHVSQISMFPCIACTSTFVNTLNLLEHLILRHKYERHFARNSTDRLNKLKVPNINYISPNKIAKDGNVKENISERVLFINKLTFVNLLINMFVYVYNWIDWLGMCRYADIVLYSVVMEIARVC